ncbi:MAG TPA: hypothetical protein VFE47_26775 [Tepidisphaeraceae bacterium]|jgi:hypothetical protein|nr:hypothetical protein [Tepidisphaeraceae bacterium]
MRNFKVRALAGFFLAAAMFITLSPLARAADEKQWLVYEGGNGPGKGKNIVLISGDEEYRSEEALPELAAILAKHHGFHCTVLFEIDPKTGEVAPEQHNNIPGLEALDKADLMIIQTRFRALPNDQMKHIDDYLKSGKPVIGLRTATHAFTDLKGEYAKYNNGYGGPEKVWADGFGRLVLGERWVNHHGAHKSESTRGIFAPDAKNSPLLNGIKDGEIWGPTDVYEARLPMQSECTPIVLGEVDQRGGTYDGKSGDPFYGMRPTDKAVPGNKKNEPMMPVAWTKNYQLPDGKPGKSFTCTCWSALDMTNEPLRRLVVNAVYFLQDMKVPEKADVAIVGDFKPSTFGFGGYQKGKKPSDFEVK